MQQLTRQTLASILELMDQDQADQRPVRHLMKIVAPILTSPALFDTARHNIEWWAWALRSEVGLMGFRDTWQEWRRELSALIRAEIGYDVSEKEVEAMSGLMLAIFNGLLLHAALEGENLDVQRMMQLQQYGWEGIIERVKAEQAEQVEQDAPKARAGKKR
jgi:hypothetical protein